jgi:hypothetical protein
VRAFPHSLTAAFDVPVVGIIVTLLCANTAAAYVPDERWSSTASGPTGAEGSPITLTWGFVRDGISIPNEGPSNLISFLDDIFNVTSGGSILTQRPWFDFIEDSFNRWGQLGGINFVYEPSDDGRQLATAAGVRGVRADIRIGGANIDGSGGTLAYTYLPNEGDMVLDTGETSYFSNSANNYRQLRNTLMHEIAHAFGLLHVESSSSALLLEAFINTGIDGPQLDDIRGIHGLYGDALEKTNGGQGNDTVGLAADLGTIVSGGSLTIGTDAALSSQAVAPSQTDFVSIANLADIDFYSFSVSGASTLDVFLTPLGGVFTQGTEDGQQATFNANARNDLTLALFDRNGTSLLALVNNAGAGQVESFSGISLPSAGEYYVRVTGANDSIQLYQLMLSVSSAVQLLTGDYNLDGGVDAADYVVWRNTLGQSGANLAADGNHNGVIDTGDLLLWRANFGATVSGAGAATGAHAVPEPETLTALSWIIVALVARCAVSHKAKVTIQLCSYPRL